MAKKGGSIEPNLSKLKAADSGDDPVNEAKIKTTQTISSMLPINIEYDALVKGDNLGEQETAEDDEFDFRDYDATDPVIQKILEFQPKPFNPDEDLLDDFTIVLFGKRRIGKTFATRWILHQMRNRLPFGVVVSKCKWTRSGAHHKHFCSVDY